MLSIIIPFYNAESTLKKCLESVLEQTSLDIEIICIDDGSTDHSYQIVQNFKDQYKNIQLVKKKNGGLPSARNLGLSLAKGNYVGFVDSDDYVSSEMFQFLLENIKKDNTDMAACAVLLNFDQITQRTRNDLIYFNSFKEGIFTTEAGFSNKINVQVWNKIYKREIIDRYQIQFPEGLWYEDNVFTWKYLSMAQSFSYSSYKYYHYTHHQNSIMGKTFQKTSKARDHIKGLILIYDFLVKQNKLSDLQDDYAKMASHAILQTLRFLPLFSLPFFTSDLLIFFSKIKNNLAQLIIKNITSRILSKINKELFTL